MKPSTHARTPRAPRAASPFAPLMALAATLLALPASAATTFPDNPLQTGAAYPPPNIMFILDDSGSMGYVSMPVDRSRLSDTVSQKSYVNNTIYYNPAIDYLPWIKADNTRYTGGRSYTSAYSHDSKLSGSVDLSDDTQTYFVPKKGATDFSDQKEFYRYQIRWVEVSKWSWELKVVRSEYRTSNGSEGESGAGCSNKKNNWQNCEFATPTGRSEADEMKNFATWYSYHRTRMKVAKASASEAFAQMGSNVRVGFDTINRNTSGLPYRIPVASSGGALFTGTNRSDWFDKLQNADANSGTPLHRALRRAGDYFTDIASSDSPWRANKNDDPISCRQNFAILTTDGYWNSTSSYDDVGDIDSKDGPTITNSTGDSYTYVADKPYKDGRESTLADVAMYYWKNDLVGSLENNVPNSDADPAFWQHMVTFGLSIGQKGNLDPKVDLPAIKNGSKSWTNPLDKEDADRIDDLWHASVNGHGSFVAASDPIEFVQGLIDALATVAARTGSASNVTANSTSFQTDTRVYQATYVSGKWTGELAAYDASAAGASATPAWLASQNIPTTRKIFTWSGTAGAPFPTTSQESALARATGLAQVTGPDNASYIKGDQSKEKQKGGELRDRIKTVLGDIVNSSPMFVKDNNAIFVGANDGMLHAFKASGVDEGKELFAYVPAGVNLSDLASLSDPQYVHRWFVDGPVVVSTNNQTPGKNYLVGSLGRGGKGVFGLDVTSPGAFTNTNVLWDSTWTMSDSSADSDMGQVLGEPLIVKLNDGTDAVIVGNGLNSSSEKAVLFILNIATGALIKKLDAGNAGGNGLSAPRGWDNDGNGTVDYVYAGDMKGNLWKFDLSDASKTNWKIANAGSPMFVAKDASNKRQPITTGLALAKDPATGKRWVFVGTGSFMYTGDVTNKDVQSMYGVIDDGSVVTGRSSAGDGDLAKRTIKLASNDGTKRAFEANAALDASKKGWYIDLVQPPSGTKEGERIVSRPQVRGTVLITASIIPPSDNTCEAGGRGYVNALDAFSGTSLAKGYFDTNGNGNFDDDTLGSGSGKVPVGSVDLGVGMPTMPTIIDNRLFVGGSKGTMASILVNPQGSAPRRTSWREILRD